MASSIRRTYANFRGVDFMNDSSLVDLTRSPDAVNVWKNYSNKQGSCIETRPGYVLLGNFEEKINGLYFFKDKTIVHAGTNLYLWNNFPDSSEQKELLKSGMSDTKSSFVIFNDKLYILDGKYYLCYDGETIDEVINLDTYIPTTTINRYPSGGGEMYQDVNCLSSYRKNSFLSDGTSTSYFLDAIDIEEVEKVTINEIETTEYTVDRLNGKVTFTTAPPLPDMDGADNVVITFKKTVSGYAERIANCKIITVFDHRIFYSGNPAYPNAIFHCALNNPMYIEDLAYYEDGTTESAVKSLVVGNNILWVLKEDSQQKDTILYHTATTDSLGRVYPNYQGNISLGCYADAINYKDDIVFLSRNGLEGIASNQMTSEQILNHRSSLVDSKLINENNYNMSQMVEWNGYLVILVDGYIYLGDMRQMFQGAYGYEYEWYYWDITGIKPTFIKEYKDNLYIGTENGSIFIFKGTNDNGEIIQSRWTTIMDNFGYGNYYKTTNKRGGIIKLKNFPNSKFKLSIESNKTNEKYINEYSTTGFDFNSIDFAYFDFTVTKVSYVVFKIKEKKFIELSLRFYSDELDKPFGLYSATIEAFLGGYVKK